VSLAARKAKPAAAVDNLPANATAEELKTAAINVSLNDLEERVADVRESWETDSLFEDALDELAADGAPVSPTGQLTLRLILLCLTSPSPAISTSLHTASLCLTPSYLNNI
jgi:hypothetical protein